MVENIPVPPSREADARNRFGRTFWQGLAVDVLITLVFTVGPMLVGSDFAFTRAYWITVGTVAAKTVVGAIVAYFARKVLPPQFDPPREVRPAPAEQTPAEPERGPEDPYHWRSNP